MAHPKEFVEQMAVLIVSKFAVTPDRARRMAEAAMDGIDSHLPAPNFDDNNEQVSLYARAASEVTWPTGAQSLYWSLPAATGDPRQNLAELLTPGFWRSN